jgi:hypothetical protein
MAYSLAKLRRKATWERELDALPTTRTCEGCDMCCTVLEIHALAKAPWTRCSHLMADSKGCGIWGDHPPACKTYVCLWRMSDTVLPADMFPGGCGFLLTIDDVKSWPTTVNVCVDPKTPDAWNTPRNRALFAKLAATWNCSVAIVGEGSKARHVFTPSGRSYSRAARPDLFPHDGLALSLQESDFGPDRRPPIQRITENPFRWEDAA